MCYIAIMYDDRKLLHFLSNGQTEMYYNSIDEQFAWFSQTLITIQ